MKTVLKNLGKTVVFLGCTIAQLIAVILRGISLVFELIGLAFRKGSDLLMGASKQTTKNFGTVKTEEIEAA